MPTGAITGYIDVAQVVLYLFWAFFAGLIYYLHRENKREGYPLISDRSSRVKVQGFPSIPEPKTFLLPHGGSVQSPRADMLDRRPIKANPVAAFLGAPLQPTGDPMRDAVGPASYAEREDKPEVTIEGHPMIVPLRIATECSVDPQDPDPRGMTVIGCDGQAGGTVKELWVDRAEPQIRYLEVGVGGARAKTVLIPMTLAVVHGAKRQVAVSSVTGAQVAGAPRLKSNDQITKLEEDKISAYFASGHLYATPDRLGPLL
jgi:photosynthetic reaction center H subunit